MRSLKVREARDLPKAHSGRTRAITGLLTPGPRSFLSRLQRGKQTIWTEGGKALAGLHGEQRGQRLGSWVKPKGHCGWAEHATWEERVGGFQGDPTASPSRISHVQKTCTRPRRASPPHARRGRGRRGGPRTRVDASAGALQPMRRPPAATLAFLEPPRALPGSAAAGRRVLCRPPTPPAWVVSPRPMSPPGSSRTE